MALSAASCSSSSKKNTEDLNPLLEQWSGPYNGVPPFNLIKEEHFLPAFEVAIQQKLEEVKKVAEDPSPATFANTIEMLEKNGKLLRQSEAMYGVWTSNLNTPLMTEIQEKIEPQLAALNDSV